jgi:hypothetical protein
MTRAEYLATYPPPVHPRQRVAYEAALRAMLEGVVEWGPPPVIENTIGRENRPRHYGSGPAAILERICRIDPGIREYDPGVNRMRSIWEDEDDDGSE